MRSYTSCSHLRYVAQAAVFVYFDLTQLLYGLGCLPPRKESDLLHAINCKYLTAEQDYGDCLSVGFLSIECNPLNAPPHERVQHL